MNRLIDMINGGELTAKSPFALAEAPIEPMPSLADALDTIRAHHAKIGHGQDAVRVRINELARQLEAFKRAMNENVDAAIRELESIPKLHHQP